LFMSSSSSDNKWSQPNKIFIGGLSRDVTSERFKQFWEEFGETTDACVMNDQMGRSRGFGFVVFRDAAVVDKVLAAGPIEIDGSRVECKRAIPKGESDHESSRGSSSSGHRTKKIFVGGLSKDTSNDEFKKYFEGFGAVAEATIMTDQHGLSRGFGFIVFESDTTVDDVLAAKELNVAGKTVDAKRAIPQGQAPIPRRMQDRRGADRGEGRGYGYAGRRDDPRDRGYDRYPPRYASYSPPRGYDRDSRFYDYYPPYPGHFAYMAPPPTGGKGSHSAHSSAALDYYAQFAPHMPVFREGDYPSGGYYGAYAGYPYPPATGAAAGYEPGASNTTTPYGKEKRGGSASTRAYHPYRS